jgi:hypothetical protein
LVSISFFFFFFFLVPYCCHQQVLKRLLQPFSHCCIKQKFNNLLSLLAMKFSPTALLLHRSPHRTRISKSAL